MLHAMIASTLRNSDRDQSGPVQAAPADAPSGGKKRKKGKKRK